MLVVAPVLAPRLALGRFLQVKLQPVQLTDGVEAVPRLAEREADPPVVRDRALEVVDEELGSEGRQSRLGGGRRHRASFSARRARICSVLPSGSPPKNFASSRWNTDPAGCTRANRVAHDRSFRSSGEPKISAADRPSMRATASEHASNRGPSTGCSRYALASSRLLIA